MLESTKSANVGNAANRVGVMDRAQAMKLSMGLINCGNARGTIIGPGHECKSKNKDGDQESNV